MELTLSIEPTIMVTLGVLGFLVLLIIKLKQWSVIKDALNTLGVVLSDLVSKGDNQ